MPSVVRTTLIRRPEVSVALLVAAPDPDTRDAAKSMLERLAATPKPNAAVFSGREVQVLAAVRDGLRNKEIASRLGISQPGVRFHLANIYRKSAWASAVPRTRSTDYTHGWPR